MYLKLGKEEKNLTGVQLRKRNIAEQSTIIPFNRYSINNVLRCNYHVDSKGNGH